MADTQSIGAECPAMSTRAGTFSLLAGLDSRMSAKAGSVQ